MSSVVEYGATIAPVSSAQPAAPPRGRRHDGRPFATPAARAQARQRGVGLDQLAAELQRDHLRLADVVAAQVPTTVAPTAVLPTGSAASADGAVLRVLLQSPREKLSTFSADVTHAFVVAWHAHGAGSALLHVRHDTVGAVRTVIANPASYSADGLMRRLAAPPGDEHQDRPLVIHDLAAVPGVDGALGLEGGTASVTLGAPRSVPVVHAGRSGLHAIGVAAELAATVRFADCVTDETRLAVLAAVASRFPLVGAGAA